MDRSRHSHPWLWIFDTWTTYRNRSITCGGSREAASRAVQVAYIACLLCDASATDCNADVVWALASRECYEPTETAWRQGGHFLKTGKKFWATRLPYFIKFVCVSGRSLVSTAEQSRSFYKTDWQIHFKLNFGLLCNLVWRVFDRPWKTVYLKPLQVQDY